MSTLHQRPLSPDSDDEKSDAELDSDSTLHILDGGLAAWSTAFGAFLIQIAGFGFVNAFGVFQDFYSKHYLTDVSPSAISWIGSTAAFLVLSGGLLFGRIYDKGYFHSLLIGGCALQTICLFMLSLIQQNQYYQIFLCQGLGFGLAASMSFVPSLAVLSHHFDKRRAIAMSIVASGTPLGAALYSILLNNLLNGNLGFPTSIRITAATNTFLLLVGCALVRSRSIYSNSQIHYSQLLKTASADFPYIFACLGLFFVGAATFFPMFYIQLDSSMHGLGTEFSFYTVVILCGGNFIGRVTAGFIATRFGIFNTVSAAILGAGIITFAMTVLSSRAGAVCIGLFFGYCAGIPVALSSPLTARLTQDLSQLGSRMGISLFMAGLGGLIGTPAAGALLGTDYQWWRPAVLCGCFGVASSVMFAVTQLILRRREKIMT